MINKTELQAGLSSIGHGRANTLMIETFSRQAYSLISKSISMFRRYCTTTTTTCTEMSVISRVYDNLCLSKTKDGFTVKLININHSHYNISTSTVLTNISYIQYVRKLVH